MNDLVTLVIFYAEQIFFVGIGLCVGVILTRPRKYKYSIHRFITRKEIVK